MTTPEVITSSSRSDGAKKMWERRRAVQKIQQDEGSWFKKHADMISILAGLLGAVIWMNGKFNDIERRFSEIENRLTKIETILYIKGIVSHEIAIAKELPEKN